ncbi:hypothetical protein RUND412_010471 [Rhizina undulata]
MGFKPKVDEAAYRWRHKEAKLICDGLNLDSKIAWLYQPETTACLILNAVYEEWGKKYNYDRENLDVILVKGRKIVRRSADINSSWRIKPKIELEVLLEEDQTISEGILNEIPDQNNLQSPSRCSTPTTMREDRVNMPAPPLTARIENSVSNASGPHSDSLETSVVPSVIVHRVFGGQRGGLSLNSNLSQLSDFRRFIPAKQSLKSFPTPEAPPNTMTTLVTSKKNTALPTAGLNGCNVISVENTAVIESEDKSMDSQDLDCHSDPSDGAMKADAKAKELAVDLHPSRPGQKRQAPKRYGDITKYELDEIARTKRAAKSLAIAKKALKNEKANTVQRALAASANVSAFSTSQEAAELNGTLEAAISEHPDVSMEPDVCEDTHSTDAGSDGNARDGSVRYRGGRGKGVHGGGSVRGRGTYGRGGRSCGSRGIGGRGASA